MKGILFLFSLGTFLPLSAGALEVNDTYSNLKVGAKSGDVVGVEFTILSSSKRRYVAIQASEGAPGEPKLYALTTEMNDFTFKVPMGVDSDLGPGEYRISVKNDRAILKGPNGFKAEVPRSKSFWVNPPSKAQ